MGPKVQPGMYLTCHWTETQKKQPLGRVVKRAVSKSLDHLTAVSDVGSSPALVICETSQVLLADVPGCFPWGCPIFAQLLISPSHMS